MADLKQYAQELFKKAGVSDERAKAVLEALGDDTVAKAFRDGFVETPHYHSTIDRTKAEWEAKVKEADAKVNQYNEWYTKQAQPFMQQAQTAMDNLKRYEQLYGSLEDSTPGQRQAAAQAVGLTKAEVDALLAQRDQNYVSLTKDITYAASDYQQRFKEPLDLDALEKFALDGKYSTLRQAYKDYVQPKVEDIRKQEHEAAIKAAREEGARDALSKHRLPVSEKPKEPHPIFDRKEAPQGTSEMQQERAAKEAFLSEWNSYQETA